MNKTTGTRIYAAYGSNMDFKQMAHRCPGAVAFAKGVVHGYRLLFKGSASGSYATIEPCEDAEVPVILWNIEERHERALDRYEGYPIFYQKETVAVMTERGTIEAMVYVMDPARPFGAPTEWYYSVLERAYERFGFDVEALEKALDDSMGEEAKAKMRRAVQKQDLQVTAMF